MDSEEHALLDGAIRAKGDQIRGLKTATKVAGEDHTAAVRAAVEELKVGAAEKVPCGRRAFLSSASVSNHYGRDYLPWKLLVCNGPRNERA
jgi:hypothetical protein